MHYEDFLGKLTENMQARCANNLQMSFIQWFPRAIYIEVNSDTIAALASSIAEVCYPIPQEFRGQVIDKLDDNLTKILIEVIDFVYCGNRR